MNLRLQARLTSQRDRCEPVPQTPWTLTHSSPPLRTLGGQAVSSVQDYAECLSELVDVCVLCNDSGLAYNEVGTALHLMRRGWQNLSPSTGEAGV